MKNNTILPYIPSYLSYFCGEDLESSMTWPGVGANYVAHSWAESPAIDIASK